MAATDPIIIPLIIDGKQITPTLNELTKELKAARREQDGFVVGSQQYEAAGARVRLLAERHREVSEATADSRNEGNKLLDVIRGFGPGGQLVGTLADNFTAVRTQAASSVGSINAMGIALKLATGVIGLVVLAIGSLITYFKSTDEGATRLEGIMKGLNLVFKAMIQPVIDLGKAIFDNPMKVLKDFGEFIKDQLINRLTSIITAFDAVKLAIGGNFKEAAKKAQDAYLQFTLGITDGTAKLAKAGEDIKKFGEKIGGAAKEGYELAAAFDSLSDRERDFSSESKKTENQIKELLLQAKNRALTEEQRQALLTKADSLVESLHNKEIGFEKERLALTQREILAENGIIVALDEKEKKTGLLSAKKQAYVDTEISKLKESGRATDEAIQKETDIKNKMLELDGKSIELREKIQNKQDALDLASEAKQQKKLADKKKAQEEELALELDFEKALEQQQIDQDLKDIEDAKLAKQARLDLITTEEEEQKLAIEQQFFGQIEAKKQQEEALYQVEKAAKERRLKEITGDGLKERAERAKLQSDILKGESERAGREIELEQRTNKLKDTLRQTNLAMASSALQLGIQFLSRDEESRKKYGVAIKGLAIADIAINLSKELSSIAAAAAANPANALTFGAAGATQGTILSGIAIGRAALQTATVLGTQYSLGGISKGSRHGSAYGVAGIAMIDRVSGLEVGEMEGNEAILTSGVVNNPTLLQAASRINVLGGGRAFAAEGAVLGGTPTSLDLADPSSNALIQEFRTMSAKIDTWQRELKVTNNITSLYKKQAEYEKMVETTNI